MKFLNYIYKKRRIPVGLGIVAAYLLSLGCYFIFDINVPLLVMSFLSASYYTGLVIYDGEELVKKLKGELK